MTPRGATSWPEGGYVEPDGESCEFGIAVVDDGRGVLEAGRRALAHRARLNGAASTGAYTEEIEDDRRLAPAHRREWQHDQSTITWVATLGDPGA